MVDARRAEDWEHTSHVMWLHAELNRDKKKKPTAFKPEEFNPYAKKRRKPKPMKADFSVLRALASEVVVVKRGIRKSD